MGQRLREGRDGAGAHRGVTGQVQIPMVLVDGDRDPWGGNELCLTALRHGVLVHPKYDMILCAAHGPTWADRAAKAHFADINAADIFLA